MNELDSFAIIRNLETLLDQLYSWAQRAQESRGNAEDASTAGRMLEVATANLEAFMRTLLDCFRALELAPIRMAVSDLVSAMAMRARADAGAASVTVTGGVEGSVSVDVARLTRALSAILQRLDPRGARLRLGVAPAERRGRPGVEIALRSDVRPRARPGYGEAELEWALARRIVALHAGALEERPASRGATIALFLPMNP
jgi:hypothetical protein